MIDLTKLTFSSMLLVVVLVPTAVASEVMVLVQDHDHAHQAAEEKIQPPRVFLDKNPRIVKFQLKRLDNSRLLLVERKDDDPKYLLVHQEILMRNGMARQDRELALQAIATINETDPVAELLAMIPTLDDSDKQQRQIARQLTELLLSQKSDVLKLYVSDLVEAANSESPALQLTGFAALLAAGQSDRVIELSAKNNQAAAAFLRSIPLLSNKKLRNSLHPVVLEWLAGENPANVRTAAISALASMDADPGKDFASVAPLVADPKLRRVAVKTLLNIPRENRNETTSTELAQFLVNYAEVTPPADRTSDEFIEAMQLADQVLGLVSKNKSDAYRKRLDAVTVRVVLIHTVEEEMRYDVPWFAVEAGRDVQVILRNEDLMAHNLVITQPGALQEVALAGAAQGPAIGASGKQYVPDLTEVLFATEMVQSERQARLTFKAPTEPGEYPYVCTFPGHWMRMYGVMVVVEDLAEFQRNPVTPKDPVGSNRPLVKAWTSDDFEDKIESGLRGRSPEIGKKLFAEATCAQCHKVAGEGKVVGPELTDVWSRWKGDATGILQEIVEPSHKIEAKYIVRKIVTIDGLVVSGIVLAEDDKTISILPNPESIEPTVIQQDDIEDMLQSSVSIMPKGLLDRFTEDEIFEILAYLKSVDPKHE
jgi:putative heme-binding domain-containing protein